MSAVFLLLFDGKPSGFKVNIRCRCTVISIRPRHRSLKGKKTTRT